MKRARELAGKTQRETAQELGVTERTINRWESGFYEPGATDIDRWATLTGVTVDWLLLRDPSEAPALSGDVLDLALAQTREMQAAIERLIAERESSG